MGKSFIHIKRKSAFTGRLWDLNIYIDGKKIGVVSNGKDETFVIQPGKHLLSVGRLLLLMGAGQATFKIEEGETLNFICEPNWTGTRWLIDRDNTLHANTYQNPSNQSAEISEETNVSNELQVYGEDKFPIDNKFGNEVLTVEYELTKTATNEISLDLKIEGNAGVERIHDVKEVHLLIQPSFLPVYLKLNVRL